MLTALLYLFDGIILALFSYRVYLSLQKGKNPFMLYFIGISSFFSLNFIAYASLIFLAKLAGDTTYLFWADYFGRLFVYMGSVFAIQVPIYRIAPKSKLKYLASGIIALIGTVLSVLNLIYPNQPYIDSLEIVHWQSPMWLSVGLAIVIIGVWLPTSAIFFGEFIRSKFQLIKSLFLGLGFLMGAAGAALQDFGTTTQSYIFINLVLTVGFVFIFLGVILKDNSVKTK